MKRLISLYKNNDLLNDAIAMLNKYLEINQVDEEAWLELCDIYLNRQNFAKAQYCYEEILAVNPLNYQYNIRYAEILYSQAVATQMNQNTLELARKYFSHGLVLIDSTKERHVNNNVVRALFGLVKTCKAIRSHQHKNDKLDNKNTQMIEIAEKRIKDIYSKNTDMEVNKMGIFNQ